MGRSSPTEKNQRPGREEEWSPGRWRLHRRRVSLPPATECELEVDRRADAEHARRHETVRLREARGRPVIAAEARDRVDVEHVEAVEHRLQAVLAALEREHLLGAQIQEARRLETGVAVRFEIQRRIAD